MKKKNWGRNWLLLTKSHSNFSWLCIPKGKLHEFFYFPKISWEYFRGGDLHDDRNLRKRGSIVCRVAPGECNRDRCAICNKVIWGKCCPSIHKFRGNYEAVLYCSLRGSPAVLCDQYVTLQKYFSHPSFVISFFTTQSKN